MGAKKKYRVYKKGGESFKPHMMYNPETGEGFMAQEYQDHLRMENMGYGHEPMMRMGGMPCYECGGGVHYEYGGSTAPQNTSTDTIGQQRKDLMKNYMAGNIYMNMLDEEQQRIQDNIQNYFASGGSTYNPNLYGQQAYADALNAQKRKFKKEDVKGFGKALMDSAAIMDQYKRMGQQQAAQPQNKPLTFSPQSMDAMPNTGFGSKQPDMFGRNTDQSFGQGNPMTLGADFNKPVGGFNPDLYMAYGGDIPMAQDGLTKREPYTESFAETAEQLGQYFLNPNAGKPAMPYFTTPAGLTYKAYQQLPPTTRKRLEQGAINAQQSGSMMDMLLPFVGQQIVDYYNPPPTKPTEPVLPENATQQDVQNYQRAKAQYEDDLVNYKEAAVNWAAKTGRMPDYTGVPTPPKDANLKPTDAKKTQALEDEKEKIKNSKITPTEKKQKIEAIDNQIKEGKKKETQPNYKETEGDKKQVNKAKEEAIKETQQPQVGFYGGPGFKYKARGSYIDPETGKRVRVREKFKSPTGGDFFGFGRSGSPRKIKNTYNIYNNPYMYQMPGATTTTTPGAQGTGLTPEQIAGRATEEQYGQYLRAMQDDPATAEAQEAADMEAEMDQHYIENAPMDRVQPRGLVADQYNPQPVATERPLFSERPVTDYMTEADYMVLPGMQEIGNRYNVMNNPELFNTLSNMPMPNFGYGGYVPMAQMGINNQFSEDRYSTFLDDANAAVSQAFMQPASTGESTYVTAPQLDSYISEDGTLMTYGEKPERVGRVKEKVKRQGTEMGRDIAATMLLPTANLIAGLAENAQMQDEKTGSDFVFTPTGMKQGSSDINKDQFIDTVYPQDSGNYGAANAKGKYGGQMAQDGGIVKSKAQAVAEAKDRWGLAGMRNSNYSQQARADYANAIENFYKDPQNFDITSTVDSLHNVHPYYEQYMEQPYTLPVSDPMKMLDTKSDSVRVVPGGDVMYANPFKKQQGGAYPEMMWNEPNYKYGGGQPQYEDGGVYDLTPDEIERVLAMGGSIEYM